jgi:hypothetical protein
MMSIVEVHAAHAVIVGGSDFVLDDLAGAYHRVGEAHPTKKCRSVSGIFMER